MPDKGQKDTEKEYRELVGELQKVYQEAADDLKKKMDDFTARYKAEDAKKQAQRDAGKITQEDYDKWKRGQVFRGDIWRGKVNLMTTDLAHANEQALSLIRDRQLSVFANNANYMEYRIDRDNGFHADFTLYDRDSVAILVKDKPELMPRRELDKDKDQGWNQRVIANSITQGILQGETIPQLAARIARDTASTDMKAMTRYARTAMTSAQNAGRLQAMRRSNENGIKVKKVWLAVADDRTRDAHLELDGKEAEVDKPFDSILGPIMYPGDPGADDANVWNCRCALGYEYPEHHYSEEDYAEETEEADEDFEEWVEQQEKKDPIEEIKGIIERHTGDWSTDELIDLGSMVAEQIDEELSSDRKELEQVRAKREELREQIEQWRKQDGYFFNPEFKAVREAYNNTYGNEQEILRRMNALPVLSKIRAFGGVSEKDVSKYANLSAYNYQRKQTREKTVEALNHYPQTWLEKSAAFMTSMKPHWTNGRAYYSPSDGEIRFSIFRSTNVHELGHRFESVITQIRNAEKEFYERRTKGEDLKWMGTGYRRDEKTREDDFVNKYMGKDYGGTAYELVSMGFQYVMTEYERFDKDTEMRNWILGILAGM